jgi:hypothetical protein
MDSGVQNGLQLAGLLLAVVGLMCTRDWLRRVLGSGVGIVGAIIYVLGIAAVSGYFISWFMRVLHLDRYVWPPQLQPYLWAFGAFSGGLMAIWSLSVSEEERMEHLAQDLTGWIFGLPVGLVFAFGIDLLVDCSELSPFWRSNLWPYCSVFDFLKWQGLQLLGLLVFYLLAILGERGVLLMAGLRSAITDPARMATIGTILAVIGIAIDIVTLNPLLDAIGIEIK